MKNRKILICIPFLLFVVMTLLSVKQEAVHLNLDIVSRKSQLPVVLDREYRRLHISYHKQWNPYVYPTSHFSRFLLEALIKSEDQRFFDHFGVDFQAKLRAIYWNLVTLSFQQGGSTLTEQVVRIVLGRPDSLWSRWIQSCLAFVLEKKYSKNEILEFYLNQVPFASNRRGFSQAANLYFNRDLETLSEAELLALVVMLRAPTRFDIRKSNQINSRVSLLARSMGIDHLETNVVGDGGFEDDDVPVSAFVEFVLNNSTAQNGKILTTLDLAIQRRLSHLLKQQLSKLKVRNAFNGAAMVVDHTSGEILAMVSENGAIGDEGGYNTTLVPRQPGSTLKPFLYADYFKYGGRPHHLIEDTPISTAISGGLHEVNNYSRTYYGTLSIREALANSLNVPTIKVVRSIGTQRFFQSLQQLGLSFDKNDDFYGEGLALGNAEVSLYEMMRAYTCIANRGQCVDLRLSNEDQFKRLPRVYDEHIADLVLDVLSDPLSRQKEFGAFYFNHQVALKTGTSTDFRDAWAFAMNRRYTVGVWIGNLNSQPMLDVTGSLAALPVVKSMIESIHLRSGVGEFLLSSDLVKGHWCFPHESGCEMRDELFLRGEEEDIEESRTLQKHKFALEPDSKRVFLAVDPRIPSKNQVFNISSNLNNAKIEWFINEQSQGISDSFAFQLRHGQFSIKAIELDEGTVQDLRLIVK